MILSHNRHGFAMRKQRRRSSIEKFFLFLLLMGAISAGIYWLFFRSHILIKNPSSRVSLLSLWEANDYQELIRVTEEALQLNPMDAENLVFNGFAHFYLGANLTITEEKLSHIDAAITSLRRVLLHKKPPLAGEIDYILGKAYFQKGEFYSDLSIQYMVSAVDRNYIAQDSYEHLGIAYNNIGEYEKSILYLLKANEISPSDMLYLVLAQVYYQKGDKVLAEEYLDRSINKSNDPSLIQKARSLLGDIYMQAGEYLKAEDQYLKITQYNPQNADAHFYLGEIYFELQDPVKARASWRRANRIDPNHFGARTRLYGRR